MVVGGCVQTKPSKFRAWQVVKDEVLGGRRPAIGGGSETQHLQVTRSLSHVTGEACLVAVVELALKA